MADEQQRYLDWLVSVVSGGKARNYSKLLRHMNRVIFYPKVFRDDNRIADAIDLRYRFGEEKNIPAAIIAAEVDISQASVLEVMVALSLRMEESIMENDNIGDRTSEWFWGMVSSLGLDRQTNDIYDPAIVQSVLEAFLERQYLPNGRGGLFTVVGRKEDMREVEIWYQMCWYLAAYHKND